MGVLFFCGKDAIEERNMAMLKCEPTEGNLHTYRITRPKARRDIQNSKNKKPIL